MKRFLKVNDHTHQLQVRENLVGCEKALGAVNVIKDEIQYSRSQRLFNLVRGHFGDSETGYRNAILFQTGCGDS